jgi:3-oxoacyl-[acyl-carrier-protein] synthase-1
MRNVYVIADNIYSPLGWNTMANIEALKQGKSGIRLHAGNLSTDPYYASLFDSTSGIENETKTFFEQIVLASALDAIQKADIQTSDKRTGFILSSTKGNISLIENEQYDSYSEKRIALHTSAAIVAQELGFNSEPLVVSHACISGLLAIITGMRLIQSGLYDRLVITGADLITSFVYSGFLSFQAISRNPCKPFDAARDGISLGEAAATVVLSANKQPGAILLSGGSVSNDANHISGPSRTGEELWLAIRRSLEQSGMDAADIDFISAHGTATRYNDEMEAKAFHLASMEHIPLNSLKGYYGHTLGAAGILESIITIHSMKENIIFPTLGYSTPGTEMPVNVVSEIRKSNFRRTLKTASGFGGCNAALIMIKD